MAGKDVEKKPDNKIRSNAFFALVVTVMCGFFVAIVSVQIQRDNILDAKISALQEDINRQKEEGEDLEKQIKFRDSDEFVEKIARERLNMVKPNEIVFVDKNK